MARRCVHLQLGSVKWQPTNWKPPRTGDKKLRLKFRNGRISDHTYTARQINWADRSYDYDVTHWREE